MISVQNLTKRYGKITALNNVSLQFDDVKVIAIMGENGAGKSTLLKIIAGILPYDSGVVMIDSYSIITQSLLARQRLGYLPEMPELYDRITGREFLFYIASLRKLQNAERIITDLSQMIGIDTSLDHELGGFSKGMKQKISLLSAIMHQPQNLLLDEPVYGLDPLASRTIQDFIKKRKGTTVLATHSTQLVEHVADSVYFLMNGNVIVQDTVFNLMKQHGTIENAYFFFKDK
ncbi:MAG: ABC transporter ATP-binding protein [Euryarchaeota archaeon]|jgi:ABC-2 type transport system ATP-binding protein|nr:ABC transporter ATP-binding protein [Euryarchaeota archaeon]